MMAEPKTIVVTTNHFRVTKLPQNSFQQYAAISYKNPRPKPSPIRKDLAREIFMKLQTLEARTFNPRAIYDGMAIMFSTRTDIGAVSFEVEMGRTVFVVAITPTRMINTADIQALIARRSRTPGQPHADHSSALTLLQQIVRQAPNMTHISLKRNGYYSADMANDLGGGIHAWKGFFQSVRPAVEKLFINVDVSNVVVYQPGPVLDLALRFLRLRDPPQLPRTSDNHNFTNLSRFLKGLYIEKPLAGSPGNWARGKKIESLVEHAGLQEFSDKNGVHWTVQQYFQAKYNCRIRYPELFGVRVGRSGAIFPAELCRVRPGQLYRKRLNEDQQRKFIESATTKPLLRLRNIVGAVTGPSQVFNYRGADFLGDMTVETKPEQLQGVILPQPSLTFGAGRNMSIKYGRWNVTRELYANPKQFTNFAVITFITNPGAVSLAGTFTKKLVEVMQARGSGFKNSPRDLVIKQINPQTVQNGLMELLQELRENRKQAKPDFFLVILPTNGAILKRQVKFWSNTRVGITTQCVREGKYENGNDQYCNNVALKINAKCGGVNSQVTRGYLNFKGLQTMVVGCDVSHPGPGAHKPSIASLVASVDQAVTMYTSFVEVQEPRHEIIEGLGTMFTRALQDYHSYTKAPLQHIIVFRDGVSEGEYDQLQEEIQQMTSALQPLQGLDGYRKLPDLTYIVVTKRHHVRFFISREQSSQDAQLKENCPAGLVIDNGIVSDEYSNFYLQSHSGLQGTSCPSHYIVIQRHNNFSVDELQRIAYSLCHNYASATRSVSIPSPVYYADRACTSANWLFSENVDLESETGTATTGGQVFDLKPWKLALKEAQLNKRLWFL